jgi:hypothetical protein
MSYVKAVLLCFCLQLALAISISAKEWRGLVPLVSTRADVERLLGLPVEPCRINVCYYETKGDYVSVKYSTEPCGNDESGNYVVPEYMLPRHDSARRRAIPVTSRSNSS